jgi:DNA-binding CsgD family transcriptional regulator
LASYEIVHDTPIVGRDMEQRALAAALAGAQAGRGCVVIVRGEAGIGKTTLLEALAHEARAQGVTVVTGHCFDSSMSTPYGLWADLSTRLPDISTDPRFPLVITQTGGDTRIASQDILLRALVDFFERLVERGPLVLLLEDLHWADLDSLSALRVLARRVRELPMLMVATYRSDEITRRHTLHQTLPQLVREARAERLEMKPLAEEHIRVLVGALYPMPPADEERLARHLTAQSEGNPLFVTELLRTLVEERVMVPAFDGDGGWTVGELREDVVPMLVQQVIDERLERLSEPTRQALEVAAVIGLGLTWDLWLAVSDSDDVTMTGCIREALDAGMLRQHPDGERLAFSHALVRATLYGRMSIPERRALHRRVAETLIAAGDPAPDNVVYHFRAARDERLTHWLIQAGTRAANAYALRSAADRYAEALRRMAASDEPTAERGWLLFSTAQLLRFADPRRATEYLDDAVREAERLNDPLLQGYARSDRGMLRCFLGELRDGLADIKVGHGILDDLMNQDWRVDRQEAERAKTYQMPSQGDALEKERVLQRLGTLVAWMAMSGRLREAQDMGERFIDEWERARPNNRYIQHHGGVYVGAGIASAGLGDASRAARRFEQSRAVLESINHHVMVGVIAALHLCDVHLPFFTDDLAGRQHLAEIAESAWRRSAGALPEGVGPRATTISLLLLEGRWAEARRLARGEPHQFIGLLPQSVRVLAAIAVRTGDASTAMRRIHMLLPDGPATEPGNAHILAALDLQRLAIELALDQHDDAGARAWLEAHQRWIAWSEADAALPQAHILHARALHQAGQADAADRLARLARDMAQHPRQPLALLGAELLLGEIALDHGDIAEAARRLDAALALANACHAAYERALVLTALARLAVARGDRPAARMWGDDAREILVHLDARPALARLDQVTRYRVDATSDKREERSPAGLTKREVEVLRLIATGHSNRDISAALGLSIRTIERHTTNIYAKIDARSRADATAFAIRRGIG